MDGKPVQIIDIEKDEETQKSTFSLKVDALNEILIEVYDYEVAVISIAGPSRQGKSFLLSYLLRYLSNPTDNTWIGNKDDPLEGFKWNHGIEPETKGIWIWSKPIIVNQSVDRPIAILVLDSQGVYDEYTDLRDWSTIVGITLLTSSCFIFNVFTDIQENVLTQLETFVNYGLLAANRDEANRHAFQRLLFLIRDWNHARVYSYGHTGGKEYITQKLSIKNNQPQASQRTRKLIKQCFEDVTCYLMPEPGPDREAQNFNGSVSQLSQKFVSKMKELFIILLNPDSLKPKVINGYKITARDLLKYFEVFVEKFNSDELPQPMDLVEAVAKATDLNLMYKLKEKYLYEMKRELQTRSFLSRYEIDKLNRELRSQIDELFKTHRKSQNHDLVKQMVQTFDTELRNTYRDIYLENEEKREQIANDTIIKAVDIYCEHINNCLREKTFVKSITFEGYSTQAKKLAHKHFTDTFGEEEIDSYAPYSLKIYKLIEEKENLLRVENYGRKFETKQVNLQAIDDSLTDYCEKFKLMLDQKVFVTEEEFNQLDNQFRALSLEAFEHKSVGDKQFMKKYEDMLKLKLRDSKSELNSLNRKRMKETMTDTEIALNAALNFCRQNISQVLELFSGNEDLNQINAHIKQKTIELFEQQCVKDSNFLNPYIKKLEAEVDITLVEFRKNFETKIQDLDHFYNSVVDEAIDRYFVQIKTLFGGKSLQSAEGLIAFRTNLISDTKQKFKDVSKQAIFDQIKDYVNERTTTAADMLLIDKLTEYYIEKMTEVLATRSFISREELSLVHNENRESVIKTFETHKKTVNSQLLNEMADKLNESLATIFKNLYTQNEQKRENQVEKSIETIYSSYKESMAQTLDYACVEPLRFDEITEESKQMAFEQLIDVCGEEKELIDFYSSKLSKLMETAERDFKKQNDIKLSEAKKHNSEAMNQSLEHYSTKMISALNENLFYSNESFRQYESSVRDSALKLFTERCKYGEDQFIEGFAVEFSNKIKLMKTKFRAAFRKNMESLELETMTKINDALSQYNQVMYLLLDAIKSEQHFSSKHEEVKSQVINSFKGKCILKNEQFKNEQISKLERAVNDSRDQFRDRILNQMKKSGDFYEKFINSAFVSYSKLMGELFSDNTSVSDEELENLHQNVIRDVLGDFENSLQDEDFSIVESNRRALEIRIMNEFDAIKRTNRARNELNEKSEMKLKLEIRDYVNEYEERMEKMIVFCGDEDDLLEQHTEIQEIIKQKMIDSNSTLSPVIIEPYLTQLEVEINKSFQDFSVIFRVNLDKQSLTLQNVIMNARKFYRQEMEKHYINTSFLKPEKLFQYNLLVVDRTIARYQSERGNMSIEKFNKFIKDSLEDIYKDMVEENNKNTPTLPAIGIDLGTTNSCVAYYQPSRPKGKVIVIPNDLGNRTTPSVVGFGDNNEEIIGEAAKDQSYVNSRNTIYSAKRLIGRQFDDESVRKDMRFWPFRVVEDDEGNNIAKVCVKVDGTDKSFFPEEISAKILKKLKQLAETHLGCAVKNAVITVPAYFSDAQKEATKDAGKIAGLNVLKIINEPTAAAIAFQLNGRDDLGSRKVLIFDFGGGTLDVVALSIEKGVIDIKAVGGDNHLGGDDIDANLVQYCIDDFTSKTQIRFDEDGEQGEVALTRLTIECEKRKRQLCSTNSVVVSVDHFYDGKDLKCELTREKFEELNNDLFMQATDLVAQVLADANLDPSDIDDIVLVGGTTRIPKIQEMLSEIFYGRPLNHSVNPDEAVAVGAAIQAAIINGNLAQTENHLKVSDVTPMSLGVKVRDGFMSVIIHRNSKVPNKYTKQYETTSDNQTEVDIEIYEGEQTMAADNRKLGTFTLSNIPPSPAGEQQIEVSFNINDEGILHVSAKILSSGEENEILITEHKGRLTNAELEQLIEQENH